MKRTSYVDISGNPIDHSFESKKTFLRLFIVIGTVIPIIIFGFIIYTMINNNKCNQIYASVKAATIEYLHDKGKTPTLEGESETVNIDKLYSGKYLNSASTDNLICSGKVKATLYKEQLIYTIDLNNCGSCSTNNRYGKWSKELSYYPTSKSIVDVIPYYNFYEREVSTTSWSKFYEKDELEKTKSKYGIYMPNEDQMEHMPKVPEEGDVVEVQENKKTQYSYKDKQWLWYDKVGKYSDFSSEQPSGYAHKDEYAHIKTDWTGYSLNYPEEKSYREIQNVRGYKYYYVKDGKKVYANNGKYTAPEDVDREKYDQVENDNGSDLYRYRDTMWRWYNGTRRNYSSYSSTRPYGFKYRDEKTLTETPASMWSDTSSLTTTNVSYRSEDTKVQTRFRYVYEILSLKVLDKELPRPAFAKKIGMEVPEFAELEDYKLEVTYRFKYRKR